MLYVMGAGRSGSTILGVTLGNCTDIFYAGELDKWLPRAGVSPLGGSGRRGFWSIVRENVIDPSELLGGETRWLERSSAVFHISKWAVRRRLRASYRRVSEDLYLAIARAAKAGHIVDTSHYPLRAWELQSLTGVDLYLVFLSRGPQSVVASFMRRDVVEPYFGVMRANAYLWLTNLFSVLVFLRHPHHRRLFVRYEDFVARPEEILRQILECIEAPSPLPDLSSLKTGLAFQGNRLLQSASAIEFKRESGDPRPSSFLTTLLQLPWSVVLSGLRPAASRSGRLA